MLANGHLALSANRLWGACHAARHFRGEAQERALECLRVYSGKTNPFLRQVAKSTLRCIVGGSVDPISSYVRSVMSDRPSDTEA